MEKGLVMKAAGLFSVYLFMVMPRVGPHMKHDRKHSLAQIFMSSFFNHWLCQAQFDRAVMDNILAEVTSLYSSNLVYKSCPIQLSLALRRYNIGMFRRREYCIVSTQGCRERRMVLPSSQKSVCIWNSRLAEQGDPGRGEKERAGLSMDSQKTENHKKKKERNPVFWLLNWEGDIFEKNAIY